ncbi:MAG TPA: M1 family metallopeptidase, partial [Chitinophagaceae bacterium]|nr:M1 family metallopeptidase [Chitinophagaceae bacterium]
MRKLIFLLSFLFAYCLLPVAYSQVAYWQQRVNYTIDVSLNDKDHTLTGFEKIEYINNSPDTLHFIWFHVWPNAYKNDKTAFTDQQLENGDTRFYFSNDDQRGYINRLDFKVNNVTAAIEDHPNHIDIIKVILPSPLPPKASIQITTPFNVKLPFNFSRGGHDGQSYQVTQWYPKPAAYDKDGWHPMPYVDQGEYYSEFGKYDVSITLPKNYVVGGTGVLQNEDEKKWMLNERSNATWGKSYRLQHPMKGYDSTQVLSKPGQGPSRLIWKTTRTKDSVSNMTPASAAQQKTLRYIADEVHDFAWFADKRFIVEYDTMQLASGKTIDVFSYFTPRQSSSWTGTTKYIKGTVQFYSSRVGEYPYTVVSAVQGPQGFGGGMEYPTITLIAPETNQRSLHKVIAHEVGHNWFYGILASNERQYAWMDEGINSYYEMRYMQSVDHHYTDASTQDLLEITTQERIDQPISTLAEKSSLYNYALITYYKTSQWLALVEKQLGTEVFN